MVYPTEIFAAVCSSTSGGLCNPVGEALGGGPFTGIVQAILGVLMFIGLPLAGIALLWAGFRYVLSRGARDALTNAHFNLQWVIVGIGVFFGAWAFAILLDGVMKSIMT